MDVDLGVDEGFVRVEEGGGDVAGRGERGGAEGEGVVRVDDEAAEEVGGCCFAGLVDGVEDEVAHCGSFWCLRRATVVVVMMLGSGLSVVLSQ